MEQTDMTDGDRQVTSAPALDVSPERVFARRMKRERLRHGLRQEDLAEHLVLQGLDLHPSAIAKIEREPDPERGIEPRMVRLNEARVIASVFSLGLDRMLSDDDVRSSLSQIEQLEARLHEAANMRDQASRALYEAEQRLADLHSRISALRQAVLAEKAIRSDSILDGLKFSPDFRETAEAFIAYWFGVDRRTLEEQGWGTDNRGGLSDPEELRGQVMVIAQIFPDLAQISAELNAKLKADIEWWVTTGMRRHEERLRELVKATMLGEKPDSGAERTAQLSPQRRRLPSRLGEQVVPAEKATTKRPAVQVRPPLEVAPGDLVSHDRWGLGRVLALEGQGARQQVQVDFGGQIMWIITRRASLKKVDTPPTDKE